MLRKFASAAGVAAALALSAVASAAQTEFATPEEAKALLEKAVAALKEDEAKALDMFASGEGGFKAKDLYVWCANAADGIVTVHPTSKGKELADIKGKHGAPFGETIMQTAVEGEIKETTYWWPRLREDDLLHQGWRSDLRRRLLRRVSGAHGGPNARANT
jgi:hypothetical protein